MRHREKLRGLSRITEDFSLGFSFRFVFLFLLNSLTRNIS